VRNIEYFALSKSRLGLAQLNIIGQILKRLVVIKSTWKEKQN